MSRTGGGFSGGDLGDFEGVGAALTGMLPVIVTASERRREAPAAAATAALRRASMRFCAATCAATSRA